MKIRITAEVESGQAAERLKGLIAPTCASPAPSSPSRPSHPVEDGTVIVPEGTPAGGRTRQRAGDRSLSDWSRCRLAAQSRLYRDVCLLVCLRYEPDMGCRIIPIIFGT